MVCKRDLTFGKKDPMSTREAKRRLIEWEKDGEAIVGVDQCSQHKDRGGSLLVAYA